jgi:hypothetical protein
MDTGLRRCDGLDQCFLNLKTSVRTTESTEDTEKRRKHTKSRRTQRATFPYFVTPGFFPVITVPSVVNCFFQVDNTPWPPYCRKACNVCKASSKS